MNRVWSRAIVAAALAASTVGLNTVAAQAATGSPQLFEGRIAAYAELHQRVYAGFPPWLPTDDASVLVLALLVALPALPASIQYRLIDHDLLLWDVDADVIIDVLPDALPRAGS